MVYRSSQGFNLNALWFLIIINFVVFIFTLINQNFIYSFLGLQPANFLHKPWTILSNLFVHGGLWHIIANMVTLYFFGSYLIKLIGEGKFLGVYFTGGILGNIFCILVGLPFAVYIGASGAIFALGGVLTVMRPGLRVFIFPIPVPLPLWIAIIGGFFVLSLIPGVAWQAHLGGLILGLIAGYFFRKRERSLKILW